MQRGMRNAGTGTCWDLWLPDSVHGTPAAVGQPRHHHTPTSFFCTISICLGPAIKLPFFMHKVMLFSLSESDLSKADSTLHNNHFLPPLFEHMKEIQAGETRVSAFQISYPLHMCSVYILLFITFTTLCFQNSLILFISLTKISK